LFGISAAILSVAIYSGLPNPEEKAQKIVCRPEAENQEIVNNAKDHSTYELAIADECLGIQLFKRKAYKEAISPLIEASSFAVDRAEVYTFVGFAYDGLSDYQNAITYFTKALDENPLYDQAYGGRAWTYRRTHQYSFAESDYARAITIRRIAYYLNGLGVVFDDQGKSDEAIEAYSAALKIDPHFLFALQNRGISLTAKGDTKGALDDFATAITDHPDVPELYTDRAYTYIQLHQNDSAYSDLNKAIALSKSNDEAYSLKAQLDGLEKNYNQASLDTVKAIESNPDEIGYRYQLSFYYVKLNLYDKAIGVITTILSKNPTDARALNERAWAYHLKGEDANGLSDAEKSVKIDPKSANSLETLAEIYEKLGRTADARANYQASLAINPDGPEANLGLKRVAIQP
jgi:tetratricopeptide (TPR) repeat protein